MDDLSQAALEGVKVLVAPTTPVRTPVGLRAVTPFEGQVTIAGLAPGTYLVVATPPARYASTGAWFPSDNGQARTVVVQRGEHPTVRFTFKRPPLVSGLVQTEDGTAAVAAPVELLESQTTVHDRPVLAVTRTTAADSSGRFLFEKLKPGQYYVRARPAAPASVPANFIYAPGTTTQRDLTPLTVEPGDEVSVGIILRNLPAVRVRGRIVDANGEPARNVLVTLTALDRTTRLLSVPVSGPGSEMAYAAQADESGQFVIASVFQGLYALRAVARRDDRTPIRAAGVAEVDVGISDVSDIVVMLAAPARLTGQFMFNGAEEPDPARTQIAMAPDGQHGHLLAGPVTSDAWHADGRFEVEGIFGAQRLGLRSSGAWYIERATLEDGTELSTAPYAFAAGRTYSNVRVWVSDRVATLSGALPSWWDPHESIVIVAFPEDVSQRTPDSRYVRTATVSRDRNRFSILGLPPGQAYLVAAYQTTGSPPWRGEELYERLTLIATRVSATDPQVYEVVLGPPLQR
ncbi:MAG: carboxypeptidase-like regulatory domain-containing protein [Vicinamibacterales bacterium]